MSAYQFRSFRLASLRRESFARAALHGGLYLYIYIYMCVCVCVCLSILLFQAGSSTPRIIRACCASLWTPTWASRSTSSPRAARSLPATRCRPKVGSCCRCSCIILLFTLASNLWLAYLPICLGSTLNPICLLTYHLPACLPPATRCRHKAASCCRCSCTTLLFTLASNLWLAYLPICLGLTLNAICLPAYLPACLPSPATRCRPKVDSCCRCLP